MRFQLYQKDGQAELPVFQAHPNLRDAGRYLPSEALVQAVNVALALGQPLLLTGEPGTGKTQLAYHLAQFFGLDKPLVFNAQTSSTATDLFYRYDALAHFQWANMQKNSANELLSPDEVERRFAKVQAKFDLQASKEEPRSGRGHPR